MRNNPGATNLETILTLVKNIRRLLDSRYIDTIGIPAEKREAALLCCNQASVYRKHTDGARAKKNKSKGAAERKADLDAKHQRRTTTTPLYETDNNPARMHTHHPHAPPSLTHTIYLKQPTTSYN